ncbi:uncharacterized protein LOC125499721 [Athalia rosae]|uniref:uncharacterized protein LOC125499721 n=1 Tax=Athalia rosae TaxID=37344 RepID=UPI002033242D|nr:uncharacterized protein LOC125499721 [Athalia rosae]
MQCAGAILFSTIFASVFEFTYCSGRYYGDHSSKDDIADFVSSENFTDQNDDRELSREKRTLVYAGASNLLLIFGLGTPLQLDRESVIVGVFSKMLYALPDNSTYYTEPGVYYSRSSKSRWSIYKVLEAASQVLGYGGKECVLRSICEAANVPFNANHGLFGELVHAFLTPSSTKEEHDDYADRDYHAAERHGREVGEQCSDFYPECKASILDIFSRIDY